jgi:DNA-binding transcriptional LysR family regulator
MQVKVTPFMSSNNGEVISQWTQEGMGLMVRSEWEAAPLIRQGLLVRVLADWHLEEAPVLALVPSRSGTSARIHRFLEHAKQALKSVPWRK